MKAPKKKNQKELDDEVVNNADEDISQDFWDVIRTAADGADTTAIYDKDKGDKAIWKTNKILNFADFCESSDHMNFPPLSEKQKRLAEYMFGDDPRGCFSNGRNTAVLVWGKGGGKDTLSALLQAYVVYILLNLKNPQRFLGMPNNVNLDLLNVAASKEQAQMVYFQIFKTLVLNWSWLRNQWDLSINGRFFSSGQDETDFMNKVTITNDAIIFPHNIRAFSGSCEAETLEGKNLLMFVLDEADAFKSGSSMRSASKIYRTVRTSAASRFKKNYKGFIISYPRSKKGFIMKMYEETKKLLNVYGDLSATWEVKPRQLFSKETFEFEGHQIPMDFYEEFRLDPMGSKAAYLCDPPDAESLFLEDQERVDMATSGFVKPLFEFRDYEETDHGTNYIRKVISQSPLSYDRTIRHVLILDLSLTKDATALTLLHREGDKIITDFSTAWIPDKKKKLVVDLQNVEQLIDTIRNTVTVDCFYADHWNSLLLIQKMRSKGIKAETMRLEYDDYESFKRLLYAGNIQLVKHKRLLNELKNLQVVSKSGKKVDHEKGAHNDMAVTIVMGVKALTKIDKAGGVTGMAAEGEYVGSNLHEAIDAFEIMEEDQPSTIQIDGFPIN